MAGVMRARYVAMVHWTKGMKRNQIHETSVLVGATVGNTA
jgi:hypothetical protein